MNNLAELVLDTVCHLGFVGDEFLDAQSIHKWLYPLFDALRDMTPPEVAALRQAAARRYEMLTVPDERGFLPRASEGELAFLESVRDGLFFEAASPRSQP